MRGRVFSPGLCVKTEQMCDPVCSVPHPFCVFVYSTSAPFVADLLVHSVLC